jgi:uncharacterized protein (DUF58 family)
MNGVGARMAARGAPQPVPYKLRWRPHGVSIGAHPGLGEGGGGEFLRHVPLLRHPDPRRIDLRMTFRDPLCGLHVRQFARSSAIAVVAVVDLSGSMGLHGRVERMSAVAELCAVLAVSAYRMGDRFGLIGCDAAVRSDLFIPATRRQGLEFEVFDRLVNARPKGASTRGLAAAADWLPARRSLVFLISDFLMPVTEVDETLDALWRHDVVPVVVRDQGEEDDLPSWGLIELTDLETGRRRLAVMRPALREAWRCAGRARRAELNRLFERRGRAAFNLVDRLDSDALTQYLFAV